MKGIHRAAPVCAVAAALATGCGGGDELSKQDLTKQANAICNKYSAQVEKLGPLDSSNPKKTEANFSKATEITEKEGNDLADLKPAGSVKQDYDKLVKQTKSASAVLDDLAEAAGDQDEEKGAALLNKLTLLIAQVTESAKAVGATDCAG